MFETIRINRHRHGRREFQRHHTVNAETVFHRTEQCLLNTGYSFLIVLLRDTKGDKHPDPTSPSLGPEAGSVFCLLFVRHRFLRGSTIVHRGHRIR